MLRATSAPSTEGTHDHRAKPGGEDVRDVDAGGRLGHLDRQIGVEELQLAAPFTAGNPVPWRKPVWSAPPPSV